MRTRTTFYLFIVALTLLDAVLLTSPNLLGKIGLWIYKYHYLRTYPKALFTVSLVVVISIVIAELIRLGVKRAILKRFSGRLLLILLMVLATVVMVKTWIDFSSGAYSHTGMRFRLGATLLPAILIAVFVSAWVTLPGDTSALPEHLEQS